MEKKLNFEKTFSSISLKSNKYEIEKIFQLKNGNYICIEFRKKFFIILDKEFNMISKIETKDIIYNITILKSNKILIVMGKCLQIFDENDFSLLYIIDEELRKDEGTEIVLELYNLTLVSCAYAAGYSRIYPIIFYDKIKNENNTIEYNYSFSNYDLIGIFCIVELKNNIIAVLASFNYKVNDNWIFFFDYDKRKYLEKSLEINTYLFERNSLSVINEKILFVSGFNCIYLIDSDKYEITETILINIENLITPICPFCKINDNCFICGDQNGFIYFFSKKNGKYIYEKRIDILENEKKLFYDEVMNDEELKDLNREFIIESKTYFFNNILLLKNGDILTLCNGGIYIYKGIYE